MIVVRSLDILLALIFAMLSLLHLYWAAGGRWGHEATVPSSGGNRLFKPSLLGTILVALALLSAMLIMLGHVGVWVAFLPVRVYFWGTWGISVIFFLRAVGEFRYVGFFKRVRDTKFADWDTWLFSPLCLLISIMAGAVGYNEA
jgi:hypothetical protein